MASRGIEVEDGKGLHISKRLFAEYFISDDETASNATRSLKKVFPHLSDSNASAQASEWMRDPEVRRYLRQLRKAIIGTISTRMLEWTSLLPEAQAVILATARGELRSRLAYEASVYLVNRALGQPASHVEVSEVNVERATAALRLFSSRRTKVVTTEEVSVGVVTGRSNGEVVGMVREGRQLIQGEQVPVSVEVSEVSGGE